VELICELDSIFKVTCRKWLCMSKAP